MLHKEHGPLWAHRDFGYISEKDWCFHGSDNFSASDWQKAGEMRSLPDVFAQTDV